MQEHFQERLYGSLGTCSLGETQKHIIFAESWEQLLGGKMTKSKIA